MPSKSFTKINNHQTRIIFPVVLTRSREEIRQCKVIKKLTINCHKRHFQNICCRKKQNNSTMKKVSITKWNDEKEIVNQVDKILYKINYNKTKICLIMF